MSNLWSSNHPARFWLCRSEIPEEQWQAAIQKAAPILGLSPQPDGLDTILNLVLGEGQFGPRHWQLNIAIRNYYLLKPFIPRRLCILLRRLLSRFAQAAFPLGWPIEDRYVRFQREVMRQLLITSGQRSLAYRHFWPKGYSYAFVLTHDVEKNKGQAYVNAVAELEEDLGFRSLFNFVPERYPLDLELIKDLRRRGFEIGVHGLRHDGKLFRSEAEFRRRAERINAHLKKLNAVGFRSPFTMRNPEWLQTLDIEYDLSFFDSDPCEPMPGGTMSVWPFILGQFVELPNTLMQDSTLITILGETTPQIWLQKIDFLKHHCGMALVNTHPDYLLDPVVWRVYTDFLQAMQRQHGYWHALPREVAKWWRIRSDSAGDTVDKRLDWGKAELDQGDISLEFRIE